MATRTTPRETVTRDRILETAVEIADRDGIESLSMRRIAQRLGVVPMALYKHVANKEEILDGIVDVVVEEVETPPPDADWKAAVRERILSARRALLRHPWAARLITSRTDPGPAMLDYMDWMVGLFVAGGFSIDLTHHAMHAMGSRLLGFTQELYDDTGELDRDEEIEIYRMMADRYPNLYELARSVFHDDSTVVGGQGCDDQFEFEFTLDLLLEGFEQLRDRAT